MLVTDAVVCTVNGTVTAIDTVDGTVSGSVVVGVVVIIPGVLLKRFRRGASITVFRLSICLVALVTGKFSRESVVSTSRIAVVTVSAAVVVS